MKNVILAVCAPFLAACTIHLQIDTDYASQDGGGGTINEEVNTDATATTSPTIEADVTADGI